MAEYKKWATKWMSKDGKVINIKDMDDDHLINTIKLLKRNTIKMIDNRILKMERSGEVDGFELFELLEKSPYEILHDSQPAFGLMMIEVIKRKLYFRLMDDDSIKSIVADGI